MKQEWNVALFICLCRVKTHNVHNGFSANVVKNNNITANCNVLYNSVIQVALILESVVRLSQGFI